MSDLAQALAATRAVEGWMTDDQARALWARAATLGGDAQIVEIGSYRGRSAIVLARAAAGTGAGVTAIDPHAGNDRGPQQIEGSPDEGEADNRAFRENLERAGVAADVRHVRRRSRDALDSVAGPVDLLYIDGAHRYRPARDDIERWGARVPVGGHMLVHDAFSAVGVTAAQVRLLFFGARFRYLGRSGSLVDYRREHLDARGRASNALRQLAELPWFVRNLAVKLAIVAGAGPVARALGHRDGPWPY